MNGDKCEEKSSDDEYYYLNEDVFGKLHCVPIKGYTIDVYG